MKQVSIVSQLDRIDRMEEKLAAFNPDILIINPLLIAYDTNEHFLKICRDFSNVIPVALVTSYVDAGILKQFKDVIEINDSKQKVVTKIFNLLSDNKLAQDKPESVELSNRETDACYEKIARHQPLTTAITFCANALASSIVAASE